MKKLPKIFLLIFFSIFILQMVCFIFLLTIPKKSQAADANFVPQVSIGDSAFQKGEPAPASIAKYIQAIYNYAIGIVGILAAVVLMFGGVVWITAGGSQERVKEAKAWIGASISGLVLLLCSYMILNTINPDLVNFKEIAPPPIAEKPGAGVVDDGICCEYEKDGKINSTRVRPEICISEEYNGTPYPGKIEEPDSGCLTSAEKNLKINERRQALIDAPCSEYKSLNLCEQRQGAGRCKWKRITGDLWGEGTCSDLPSPSNKCCQAKQDVFGFDPIHCIDIEKSIECKKEVFNFVENKDKLYDITEFDVYYKCNNERGECEEK